MTITFSMLLSTSAANRARLAVAPGLAPDAPISEIARAANSHRVPK